MEKYLPVDKSPIHDHHDGEDDYVNANDPERRFVPIEDVADPDSDFTAKEVNSEFINDEPINLDELDKEAALGLVRKDIKDYTYKEQGVGAVWLRFTLTMTVKAWWV